MSDIRLRSGWGEGSVLFRRLRILRHRAARWFSPPVRAPRDVPASRDDQGDDQNVPPVDLGMRRTKIAGPLR